MKQLERIYLMNVVLHLEHWYDIQTFIQINKKCFTAVDDLKMNPCDSKTNRNKNQFYLLKNYKYSQEQRN